MITVVIQETPGITVKVSEPETVVVTSIVEKGETGAAGPAGSPVSGSGILDFGSGAYEASLVVGDQAEILATSSPSATIASRPFGSYSDEEVRFLASLVTITVTPPVAGSGFTIYARSQELITNQLPVLWRW